MPRRVGGGDSGGSHRAGNGWHRVEGWDAARRWPSEAPPSCLLVAGSWVPAWSGDEAATVMVARRPLDQVLQTVESDPALLPYYLLMNVWALPSTNEWWLRLPSVLAMAAAVAATSVLADSDGRAAARSPRRGDDAGAARPCPATDRTRGLTPSVCCWWSLLALCWYGGLAQLVAPGGVRRTGGGPRPAAAVRPAHPAGTGADLPAGPERRPTPRGHGHRPLRDGRDPPGGAAPAAGGRPGGRAARPAPGHGGESGGGAAAVAGRDALPSAGDARGRGDAGARGGRCGPGVAPRRPSPGGAAGLLGRPASAGALRVAAARLGSRTGGAVLDPLPAGHRHRRRGRRSRRCGSGVVRRRSPRPCWSSSSPSRATWRSDRSTDTWGRAGELSRRSSRIRRCATLPCSSRGGSYRALLSNEPALHDRMVLIVDPAPEGRINPRTHGPDSPAFARLIDARWPGGGAAAPNLASRRSCPDAARSAVSVPS